MWYGSSGMVWGWHEMELRDEDGVGAAEEAEEAEEQGGRGGQGKELGVRETGKRQEMRIREGKSGV